MTAEFRVLPPVPYGSLSEYVANGGGVALDQARRVEPGVLIDEVAASGLRGRGGAGFPTGVKWRTVAEFASDVLTTSMVVNASEGEPGTFKDRALMMTTPYSVIEGALIAALAVGAREMRIAMKASFTRPLERMRRALDEIANAGWYDPQVLDVAIVEGPSHYLYGEETALLEVIEGRPPLPRIAPPYRRGAVDVVFDEHEPSSVLSRGVTMAGEGADNLAPPALVNNVETLANVPAIIARGADWYRGLGTDESPGTILCTATGGVRRHGVYEVAMGTPLRDLIAEAGGPAEGVTLLGVLGGASNAFLGDLDTPISYEGMAAAGSGLGSASFRFVGDDVDPLALAAGVSRFLSVESCGQCTPCKIDGLEITRRLEALLSDGATEYDVDVLRAKLSTVADGARCNLGRQHQIVVGSLVDAFPQAIELHLQGRVPPSDPVVVGELVDIEEDQERVDPAIVTADPAWSGLQTGPTND